MFPQMGRAGSQEALQDDMRLPGIHLDQIRKRGAQAIAIVALLKTAVQSLEKGRQGLRHTQVRDWPGRRLADEEIAVRQQPHEAWHVLGRGLLLQRPGRRDRALHVGGVAQRVYQSIPVVLFQRGVTDTDKPSTMEPGSWSGSPSGMCNAGS